MATVQLNAQDFEKTITDNNLVFVDFWATWCGPCRAFGPTFEAASEENPDIVFGKVDIDANQDLASAAGIQAVPKGQTEAALAIGMTRGQIYLNVIFPQAIRLVMPSLLAQVVILIKDTTLGYVVSYSELQFSAKVLVANTGYLIQTYLTVTVVFILVNLAIARTADLWTKRQRRRYLNAGKAVAPTVTM